MTAGVHPVDEFNDYFKSPRFAKVIYRVMWLSSSGEDSPGAWPAGTLVQWRNTNNNITKCTFMTSLERLNMSLMENATKNEMPRGFSF